VIPHFATLNEAVAQPPAAVIRVRRRSLSPERRIVADLLIPDAPDPAVPAAQDIQGSHAPVP